MLSPSSLERSGTPAGASSAWSQHGGRLLSACHALWAPGRFIFVFFSRPLSQEICDRGFMTLVQQMRKLNFTEVRNLPKLQALVGCLIAGPCSLHPPGTRPFDGF